MTTTTMHDTTRFSEFLKNWRKRKRLSQLELSLQTGISQRHISFLETGRSKPSTTAIHQLSQVLEMPAAEVDAMLLSAGFAARSSRKGWSENTLEAVNASIAHVLEGHAPYPAVVVDRIWNLINGNVPAQQFFQQVGSSGDSNILRDIMRPGQLRNNIINWEETSITLYRMLELEVARRPHDEQAHQLIEELSQLEGIAELISQPSVSEPQPVMTIQFQVGENILSLFSMIATIGMSADAAIDDMRIETLLPANEQTREWFNG